MASKSALLMAARGNVAEVADSGADVAEVEVEVEAPAAPAAPRKKPGRKPKAAVVEAVPTRVAAPRATAAKAKPAASTRYEELVAIGSPRAFLENNGLGGGPSVVLNVQLPAPLSQALEAWVAQKPGRHKKALINALLAAYLADEGLLELGE